MLRSHGCSLIEVVVIIECSFLRDQRLIMSVNGMVVTGKWELPPNGKLLINRLSDRIVLNHQFIDYALMILQESGSDEDPFLLVGKSVNKFQ